MTAKSRSIDNRERAGNRKDILWPIQLIHKQLQPLSKTPNNKGHKKRFTQEEVNELMGKLRRETKSKYADYDSLKEKAAKLDELEEAQKTSEEKLQERLTSRILHHYFGIYCIHNLVLNQIFVYLMKWFYFVYISPKIKFFHV